MAGDERGPRGHAQADVQRHGLPLELAQPALQRRGGPDRAQPIVLVARPRAEDGDEPVGEPLHHRVSVAPQHGRRLVAAAAHHLLEHLRVERPDALGAAHVGRDADHLAARRQRLLALHAVEQRDELGRGREPEVVGQRPARPSRGLERLGPAPAALEGPDELEAQGLAQRMLGDQRRELAEHLLVAAQGEVGLDTCSQAGQAHLLQTRHLTHGERLIAQLVQRRPAPQRHRAMERVGRGGGVTAFERGRALVGQAGEAIGVDRLGVDERERVAAAAPGDRLGAHGRAQPRDDHLQRVGRVRRERLAPERVDGAVGADRFAAAHEQEPEKAQRLPAHGDDPAVRRCRFHGTQDAELHVPPDPAPLRPAIVAPTAARRKAPRPCKRSMRRTSAAARAPPPGAGTSGRARSPRWAPGRAAARPAGARGPPR